MSELQVTVNPTFPTAADLTVETSVRFYSEVTTGNANVSNICVKYAARMFLHHLAQSVLCYQWDLENNLE